jgi:hemoglobin
MISEEKIRQMVTQFYVQVLDDEVLAPVFAAHIAAPEWPAHLDRMCDFWSSVLTASGRFHGNPAAVHAALPQIRPEHFDRWLALFEPVLYDVYDPETAAQILVRAQRMRANLQRACQL